MLPAMERAGLDLLGCGLVLRVFINWGNRPQTRPR